MTTLAAHPHRLPHHVDPAKAVREWLTRALLACGLLYALVYVVANDVIAAQLQGGYSRVDQAVSELSAVGAPSGPFLRAMLPVFTALMLGFAAGVWRAARGSRALRFTSALLFCSAALGVSWLWFPMTARVDMVSGPMAVNDVGHLVLSGLTVVLVLLQMGFGAAALGKRFRIFSAVAAVTLLAFGAAMGPMVPGVSAGEPTRWMGLCERIMLGGWLAWLSAFAAVLMRA